MMTQGSNNDVVAKFARSVKKLSESQLANQEDTILKSINAEELMQTLKVSSVGNRKSIAGCVMFLLL